MSQVNSRNQIRVSVIQFLKEMKKQNEFQHLTSNFDSSTREFSYHNVTRVPLNFAELN